MKTVLMPKAPTWPAGICAGLLACSLVARAAEPWTLERALDYAHAHNPDARIAQQRIIPVVAEIAQPQMAEILEQATIAEPLQTRKDRVADAIVCAGVAARLDAETFLPERP